MQKQVPTLLDITGEVCKQCGSRLVSTPKESVCPNCGMTYPHEHSFTGMTPRRGSKGNLTPMSDDLGSYISPTGIGQFRRTVGTPLRKLGKIQNLFIRSSSKGARAQRIVAAACHVLGLDTSIREETMDLCRRILRTEDSKHISLPEVVALSIFVSSRGSLHRRPINLHQISEALRTLGHKCSYRTISRTYGKLQPKLKFRLRRPRSEDYVPALIDRTLRRHSSWRIKSEEVDLTGFASDLWEWSGRILRAIDSFDRGGRSPYAFAASVIYVAYKRLKSKDSTTPTITQRMISEAVGVDEYTIREQVGYIRKKMRENLMHRS